MPHVHIGRAEEAPAKAADQVDHRIEQAEGAPRRRQHADRIEGAAEKGERRHDQHRNELQLLPAARPDAQNESEQAEGQGGHQQECDHPDRVQDVDGDEQRRGREDHQTEDHRLGRRRAHVGDDDFRIGDRRRQQFVDRADEFRKEDSERGVRQALGEQREHDQPRHDEGAVAHAVDRAHARADGGAEDDEVQATW